MVRDGVGRRDVKIRTCKTDVSGTRLSGFKVRDLRSAENPTFVFSTPALFGKLKTLLS